MYCSKCGNAVAASHNYCGRCGAKLTEIPWTGASRGISKRFYMISIIGSAILSLIFISLLVISSSTESVALIMSSLMLGYALSIYAIVMLFLLLYKSWASIQDGHARTTPCKAVGFSFIPLFNIYWVFMAFWGFAVDYNKYLARHNISVKRINEGVFLGYCILVVIGPLLSLVPGVVFVILVLWLIFFIIIINQLCNSVNSLARSPSGIVEVNSNL